VLVGLRLPVRCTDDADPNVSVRRVTPSVHSKYMLVKGKYGGQANMRIVFTGSQNFDEPSLHWHDETWWKFASQGSQYPQNASLHRQFTANFTAIWAEALPCRFFS
jgi:phosphatidylserine/phosphatidylglycerophosphate/cardiolipin synthase-like enzyme